MTKWVNKSTTAYSAMLAIWIWGIFIGAGIYAKVYREFSLKAHTSALIILAVEFLMLSIISRYFFTNRRYQKVIDKYDSLGYKNKVWGYIIALICFWGTIIWTLYTAGFWQ